MITIRQSTLNELFRCPRRVYFSDIVGLPRKSKKELPMGSAVHDAIECYFRLRIGCAEPPIKDIVSLFRDELAFELIAEKMGKESRIDDDIDRMAELLGAYLNDVCRHVKPVEIERRFEVPFPDLGFALAGTMDLVDAEGFIWDHKTSASAYDRAFADKQIQPTAYYAAYRNTGRWPRGFKYGVMAKDLGVTQIVETSRTPREVAWFLATCRAWAKMVGAGLYPPNPGYERCAPEKCEFWRPCHKEEEKGVGV